MYLLEIRSYPERFQLCEKHALKAAEYLITNMITFDVQYHPIPNPNIKCEWCRLEILGA